MRCIAAALSPGDGFALETHFPGTWRKQVEDEPSDQGLSASGQAGEAQGLAAANVEADIIHGIDPTAVRTMDLPGEIADLDEWCRL